MLNWYDVDEAPQRPSLQRGRNVSDGRAVDTNDDDDDDDDDERSEEEEETADNNNYHDD